MAAGRLNCTMEGIQLAGAFVGSHSPDVAA